MKELLKSLKHVLVIQLISWGLFILIDENTFLSQSTAENLAFTIGLIIQLLILVIYYIYTNKEVKKNDLNLIKYNIFLFIFWNILSFLTILGFTYLVNNEYLHICQGTGWDCFLNGIEYMLYGLSMIALSLLILFIDLVIVIYKWIIKRKRTVSR